MGNANHAKRLEKLGKDKDIPFCLTVDEFDVVPVLKGRELIAL